MKLIWVFVGGPVGAVIGFAVALIAMSMGPARGDGTYGMREMLVCVPAGALIGLVAGIIWAFKTRIGAG